MIPGSYPSVAGQPRYNVDAVYFDGATYVGRSSAIVGAPSSGRKMTFSCWIQAIGNPPSGQSGMLLAITASGGGGGATTIARSGTSGSPATTLSTNAYSNSGTTVLRGDSTAGAIPIDGQWHYVAFCGDGDAGTASSIVDGVVTSGFGGNSASINFAYNTARIGRFIGSGSLPNWLNAYIAEFWWDTSYIDLTNPANLAKFRSPSGKPVFLGSDGSLPTGTAPLLYFSGDSTDFPTNRGTGGAFTVSGTLTTAPNSPSD
jgi:hypothetical protein